MTVPPLPLMSDGENLLIPMNLTGRHQAAARHLHGIEALLAEDLAKRQLAGIARFAGDPVRSPLPHRDQLVHAYHRALDLALDLRRAIAQSDAVAPHSPAQQKAPCHE